MASLCVLGALAWLHLSPALGLHAHIGHTDHPHPRGQKTVWFHAHGAHAHAPHSHQTHSHQAHSHQAHAPEEAAGRAEQPEQSHAEESQAPRKYMLHIAESPAAAVGTAANPASHSPSLYAYPKATGSNPPAPGDAAFPLVRPPDRLQRIPGIAVQRGSRPSASSGVALIGRLPQPPPILS